MAKRGEAREQIRLSQLQQSAQQERDERQEKDKEKEKTKATTRLPLKVQSD